MLVCVENTLQRALNDDLSVRGIRNLVDEINKPAKKTPEKAVGKAAPPENRPSTMEEPATSGPTSFDEGSTPPNGNDPSRDESTTVSAGEQSFSGEDPIASAGRQPLPSNGQTLSAQTITTELKNLLTQIEKIEMLDEKVLSEAEIIVGFLKDFLKPLKIIRRRSKDDESARFS